LSACCFYALCWAAAEPEVRWRSFFRSADFFPPFIGMLSCGNDFPADFGNGSAAELGALLGNRIPEKQYSGGPRSGDFGVQFVNLWRWVAIPTVLILAGLQTIPPELNESAGVLDGGKPVADF
jgi:raffinose/stachyose/melibiose transport system permease protein